MENLRKNTKIKLCVMLSSMSLPLISVLVMAIGRFKISEDSVFSVFQPLPYIICVGVEAWLAFKNYRYIKILKDNEYAEYVLIKKNDERNKMIRLQSNALVHKIFIYVLGVILVFTAFVDKQYFYTAAALSLVFAIIHIAVNIYYHKKY